MNIQDRVTNAPNTFALSPQRPGRDRLHPSTAEGLKLYHQCPIYLQDSVFKLTL